MALLVQLQGGMITILLQILCLLEPLVPLGQVEMQESRGLGVPRGPLAQLKILVLAQPKIHESSSLWTLLLAQPKIHESSSLWILVTHLGLLGRGHMLDHLPKTLGVG